ncbi:MAG: hypothetical protein ACHQDC_06140 [Acidimicrobiales bacterium]
MLPTLVREYLLCGHLIDRAGMPHLISQFGRETMAAIAIDEWMGASPVYSKRTQRALDFEGDSVETIFKNIQIDIGSPPQFMDFRFAITDRDHGEFWLDHCGALMDVEPMGDEFVHSMCHDIEDPTFDATATAANARAQVRPIHRPPRTPADRSPHCAWTVIIDESHPELPVPQQAKDMWATTLAQVVLDDIDPADDGRSDYSDPMLDDLRFEDFSRSALVRIAQEVCIQWHLLSQAFRRSTGKFAHSEQLVTDIFRRQFTGIAGLTAERLKAALGLGDDLDAVAQVLELHPAFLPRSYIDLDLDLSDGRLVIHLEPGVGPTADGDWVTTLSADHLEPLDAIVRGVNPSFRCDVVGGVGRDGLAVEVVMDDSPAKEAGEVALTRFSTGADFHWVDRGTPVRIATG